MFKRICLIAVSSTLVACVGQPTQTGGSKQSPAVAALYARLDADAERYTGARSSTGHGNAESAQIESSAALDDLQLAATQCAAIGGCETSRFFAAFDRLLRLQVATPAPAGGNTEAPDATPEVGESSPVVAALPEAGRSVALLKGRELSEIIALNDPLKVALEQWLTQSRPNLMRAYENYEYMRSRMWPEYEKAGLPEALLFGMLAQESGGKVHAVSRSGASGPLQFMSVTGARFGLGVVDGFDQRFDPALSARANAAYINEQLGVFNDNLELAIGAYNGGEGAMQRLAARQPDAGFWSPKIYFALSPETRDYVPSVLAAAWLFLHPERYHLSFPKLNVKPASIVLTAPASLDELTICLGQAGNEDGWFRTLRNLNPAFDPRQRLDAGTTLCVPEPLAVDYAKSCASGPWLALASDLHAAALPVGPAQSFRSAPRSYVVRKGDTLGAIAHKHGCSSASELAQLNHLKPPHYDVRIGQTLQVPSCGHG